MHEIQDLPPTSAPIQPPAKRPPPAPTEQLPLMLLDTSAASSQEPIMTPAERHLRPAKRLPPPPPLPAPGKVLRRRVVDAGYKQAEVAPAAGFPRPLAAMADAIAEPETYSSDFEHEDKDNATIWNPEW